MHRDAGARDLEARSARQLLCAASSAFVLAVVMLSSRGCGGLTQASCVALDGAAITCSPDAPVCVVFVGGTDAHVAPDATYVPPHSCAPLGACSSDPSCACIEKNGVGQCYPGPQGVNCTETNGALEVTCISQ